MATDETAWANQVWGNTTEIEDLGKIHQQDATDQRKHDELHQQSLTPFSLPETRKLHD